MEIERHRGMNSNEHIRIGSNSYEKEKILKYLGFLETHENYILKEIKCRLKSRKFILSFSPNTFVFSTSL